MHTQYIFFASLCSITFVGALIKQSWHESSLIGLAVMQLLLLLQKTNTNTVLLLQASVVILQILSGYKLLKTK